MYRHSYSHAVSVQETPERLFEELDDHERLSAHMMKSSAMMLGSSMRFELDALRGREVGSKITLLGWVLGIALKVEEVVTDRSPPRRKTWETIGEPKLLVIGRYRMGFEIAPSGSGSDLRVFIDYDLPSGLQALTGLMLGHFYAKWCVRSMADGAAVHFHHAPDQ